METYSFYRTKEEREEEKIMNFSEAFSKTIGKEQAKAVPTQQTPDFTSDDMKAYVDAKFEQLKKDLVSEFKTVETPKEVDSNNGTESNNIERSDLDASSTDLSDSEHDS